MEHTLNALIKAENIMGVYRNYSSQMSHRKARMARVVLEILIHAAVLLHDTYRVFFEVYTGKTSQYEQFLTFTIHYSKLFSTITIMVCAIQSSHSYKIFVQNIIAVHQCFNTDQTKTCSRKFKNFFITGSVVLSLCGVCMLPLRIIFKILFLNARPSLSLVLLLASEIFSELRFSIEHVVFYIYISMVQCLLNNLKDYVSELQKYYDEQERKACLGRNERTDHLMEERMEEWATNYMLLVGCSKELSACFSFQMKFSLALSLMHYISSVYRFFELFHAHESYKYFGIFQTVFVLIYSLCGTLLVLMAGQKLINEAEKTRIRLLKLNNKLLIHPTSKAKAIKNLCLLVKANPVKIEYSGRVVQGMYLIPIVLSLSISHIIVTLQFNHLI